MDAVEALTRIGGVAGAREVLRLVTRRQIKRALDRGEILRPGPGRYVLPTATSARVAAAELRAVVCLRTVVDCARRLPFDEALAIADSALRSGRVSREELTALEAPGRRRRFDGWCGTPTGARRIRSSRCCGRWPSRPG